ncbi:MULTISPECIES: copper homeostasis membrane protein CopD [Pseudomonas]|nr:MULTISPECIES: copper homeostasis membrane protein CopD [Pseudomonas]RRW40525.1 copper resistance protein CopD [Pseudomonas luteola]RRW43138.1 copper resistance protein CopD [Pseudomonas luteola]
MGDWINIAVRFALYADLMLLFGLPLFGLYALRGEERLAGTALRFGSLITGTAVFGIMLSLLAMLVLAKSMSGVSQFMELERHVFEMIISGTDVGFTWIIRIAALMLALLAALLLRRWPLACLGLVSLFGAVALATLAWAGHGAMDEGTRRYVHFTSDIFHLVGAGAWLGALAAFGLLLRPGSLVASEHMHLLSRVLNGFATTGTVIVVTLSITGVINYGLIVGPTLDGLLSSLYGQLLLAKLALFALMLVLAAANRFRLSPLLERSIQNYQHQQAVTALRRSLFVEIGAAILILGLVAWLGTLSPEIEMAME